MKIAPFETARLALRALEAPDAAPLQALTDDPAITSAVSFLTHPFTLEAAMYLIAQNTGESDCFLGIWRRPDNQLVGVVGIHLRQSGRVEIGYWIGADFQGQGYATEAAQAALAAIRADFSTRQIVAECRPENSGSRRVLEKLGFLPTGRNGTRPGRILLAVSN